MTDQRHHMYSITKKLKHFSAAHRLVKGYQGKCQHLHGHNYSVELTIAANELNDFGFVIDFNDIKKHFETWINHHWDHATLVSEIDQALYKFVSTQHQKYYLLPGENNTTAEYLAEYLFHKFSIILKKIEGAKDRGLTITSIKVFETETSAASYHE